jgi:DNA-binding LacI/PurR family transcriptional regulator
MVDQITIKDIARHLNISVSTVSRALRDHPDISLKTKLAVKEFAEQKGYQPNFLAQNLKKKQSSTIGVIVPEIRHNFFASALNGIEDIAYEAGYTMLVTKSNENYNREIFNIRSLISNRVAGLIVSISQETQNYDHFKQPVPIIFFDRVPPNSNSICVVVDDRNGAYEAVEHLIKQGYQKIAHFAGPKHLQIASNRLNGYREALEKYGMTYREELIVFGGMHEEDGMEAFTKLYTDRNIPDAIFAVNDPVAIGAVIRIKEYKLKIPNDIAIVGFSNNPISALIDPPLTTVIQPAYEMGKKAAELLLSNIEKCNAEISSQTIIMDTELIIREST